MKANRRKDWISSAMGMASVLLCALVLGVVFYGAMAYQMAGERRSDMMRSAVQEDGLLALPDVQLLSQEETQQTFGGEICSVVTRVYQLEDGVQAQAVTASPAAYIERLAAQGYEAQRMTGFVLAGMDAVYSVHGMQGMLSAREGERIYLLSAPADEQMIYALGAAACLN